MTTASAQEHMPSDAELITASREGSAEAYAELYHRHRAAAYNLARQLARSPAEADDLVSEAFAKLLDTLRSGGGPDSAFRPYLLTALRHCAYDRTRSERRIELSDDISGHDPGVPFTDPVVAGLDRSLAARAFAQLPERWQTVLWHTEIEGQSPAEVAPMLGLSPNGVSALAYRAREGLRQAYLQEHLAEATIVAPTQRKAEQCQAAIDRLGAWTRGGLSRRETAQVEQHLDECERCRVLAYELADVNSALRVCVAPLVLGGATAGYLAAAATATAAKGTATAAVVAGIGTVARSGAGTGTSGGAAASAGPRQLLTVGGSAAALAAAIVIGLLAGPGEDVRPQAAPPSPTTSQPPAQPPPAPPGQPPVQPPPAPPPGQPPAQPPSAAPPAAPPAPGQPALAASAPAQSLELEAGGPPVTLPITVRNTGTAPSAPVVVQLNLPPGVTATGTGTSTPAALPAATAPQSAQPAGFAAGPVATSATASTTSAQAAGVSCSGGTGSIRCATAQGLPPGGQTVFVFTLAAAPGTVSGEVSGTFSGGGVSMRLAAVRLVIRPIPDVIDVRAAVKADSPWRAKLSIVVTDTGRTSGQVTTTVALPDGVHAVSASPGCLATKGTVTCTTSLAPGQQASWQVVLAAHHHLSSGATITAVMGTARQSRTVQLKLSAPCTLLPGLPLPPLPPLCPPGHVPHLLDVPLPLHPASHE